MEREKILNGAINLKTMRNMKRVIFSLAILALIVSCSKESTNDIISDGVDNQELTAGDFESVLATAGNFEFADSDTKTLITQSGSDAPAFAWKEGDVIGIIPNDNKSVQANYEIAEIGDDPKSARFDGGSWALKRDKQYAAYYPYREKLVRSADTLQFSFLGQIIEANNSLAHLGAYDYMYANATFPDGGNAALNFNHLISLVRFQITVNHNETYTKLALNSPDNCDWFASKASLTLGTGAMTALQSQKSIEIPFDNIALSKGDVLTVWIAMLPTDVLSSKSLDFTLHGTEYTYSGKFTNLTSFKAGKAYSFSYELPQVIDLSESGSANCYIVDKGGEYKFKAVKGNSDVSIGEVKGVKVLWETFGTATAPQIGDLIKTDVSYSDGYITFSTNDTYHKGNAVIAAYSDAGCTDGNVLWSWHIWLTDQPAEHNYDDQGILMDRNLGATSGTPGDVEFLGLFYQWGRKDPFLGSSNINNKIYPTPLAQSTIDWPSSVETNDTKGTVDYVTRHPTIFLTSSQSPWDWSIPQNDNLWSSGKTQFDPCPPGWQVPNQAVWAQYLDGDRGNRGYPEFFNKSKTFLVSVGYYPAAGGKKGDNVYSVGDNGYYWTFNITGTYSNYIFLDPNSVNPGEFPYYYIADQRRSNGYSVRCQKIE